MCRINYEVEEKRKRYPKAASKQGGLSKISNRFGFRLIFLYIIIKELIIKLNIPSAPHEIWLWLENETLMIVMLMLRSMMMILIETQSQLRWLLSFENIMVIISGALDVYWRYRIYVILCNGRDIDMVAN